MHTVGYMEISCIPCTEPVFTRRPLYETASTAGTVNASHEASASHVYRERVRPF